VRRCVTELIGISGQSWPCFNKFLPIFEGKLALKLTLTQKAVKQTALIFYN
jgi:hypothetical protein